MVTQRNGLVGLSIALDYTSPIDPSALTSAGVSDVCRYLSWLHYWGGTLHDTVNPKIIQKAEFDTLVAGGIGVTLNWEYDARDWLSGSTGAQAHANEAAQQAAALGYPQGCTIVGSADFDITRADWDRSCHAYATTWDAVIRARGYRPGVYGPWDALKWCSQETSIDAFWQAAMSRSWSQGRNAQTYPGAHLAQRGYRTVGGVSCDWNEIRISDWGQFRGGNAVATGDADKAFSSRYTGTEPWIVPDSWMGLAVERPINNLTVEVGNTRADIAALPGKISVVTPAIDYDLLADKVAERLAPLLPTVAAIATATVDEQGRRINNG